MNLAIKRWLWALAAVQVLMLVFISFFYFRFGQTSARTAALDQAWQQKLPLTEQRYRTESLSQLQRNALRMTTSYTDQQGSVEDLENSTLGLALGLMLVFAALAAATGFVAYSVGKDYRELRSIPRK